MKGQISIIEAIVASVALFIAFNAMMPEADYDTKWNDALNSMQGTDVLITADNLGKLYDYSFSPAFNSEFLNRLDTLKDSIVKLSAQGAVRNTLHVACDCTAEQLASLQNILSDIKFNSRAVSFITCSTALPAINNCGSSATYPDILLIWGYKDMTLNINALDDFVKSGNSVIELADIPNSKINGQGNDDDLGQGAIFGLVAVSQGDFPSNPDSFLIPANASQITYQSYKWFHHLPYLLKGTPIGQVPTEGGIQPCILTATTGNFRFQDVDHVFWICGGISVYWDTNGNNVADLIVSNRNNFSIGSSNFFMNYIDGSDKIRVSFKPDYIFNDFIVLNNAHNKLGLNLQNYKNNVPISMGFWDQTKEIPIPAVTFYGSGIGKAVWVADFSRDGLTNIGDDHKQLLASLIVSLSSKETKLAQQIGEISSYINVNTMDVPEIYKLELSVGKPF